jgi:AraC family transcriptional regulator
MNPNVVTRNETLLVGLASRGGSIHDLWQAFEERAEQVKHKTGAYFEVHTVAEPSSPGNATEYLVSVEVTRVEDVPEGLVERRLPAGAYAVFTHCLANGGFTGCNDTMDAWLESGPYRLSSNTSIQVFDDRFKGAENPDSIIDFLLPVAEKK